MRGWLKLVKFASQWCVCSLIFPSLRRDEHQGYQFPSTLLYTRREHPHRVGRNLSFAFEVCGKAAVINLHRSACCELTPRRYPESAVAPCFANGAHGNMRLDGFKRAIKICTQHDNLIVQLIHASQFYKIIYLLH